MVDLRSDEEDRSFTSIGAAMRFFDAPFLRENLDDLTLALGLGRPVFLLGPAGSGKSTLADQVGLLLAKRYGIARIEGRPGLGLGDVARACRLGFRSDAWAGLVSEAGDARELGRPGDNLLIVDGAEAILPRVIEQMVAASNGCDLLPSHRILFAGGEELAEIIETGQVRNHWGAPVVVDLKPWHGDVVVAFLRQRLKAEGLEDSGLLAEATLRKIAAEADGNPGRMLDLGRRMLEPAGRDPPDGVEPAEPAPSPDLRRTTITKLAAAERPKAALFVEPSAAPPLALRPTTAALVHQPMASRRWILKLGLPVCIAAAAGYLIWTFDLSASGDRTVPQQTVAAGPASAAIPAPAAVAMLAVAPSAIPPSAVPPPPIEAPAPVAASTGATDAAPSVVSPPAAPASSVPLPAEAQNTLPAVSASPAAAPAPSPPTVVEGPSVPSIPAEALIARGDALLTNGDFAAARLFYLQAAKGGSAKAALAVARTYDPLALTRLGVIGARGEPDKAMEWYRKAADLGDPAAVEPLRRLSSP